MQSKRTLKIPPPIYMLGCVDLVLALDYLFPVLSFYFRYQTVCALAVAILGVVFISHAGLSFILRKTTVNPFKPHESGALVTTGFYRVSRNPMYLGMALLLLSSGVYLGTLLTFLPVALFVFIMNVVQIKPEEKALAKIFGEEYTDFTKRVRRWV